ncbi:MAG: hypothetical protein ABI175_15115 [Polyangiales bacterium]
MTAERASGNDEATALVLDLLRASGLGLLRGRLVIPTPRLVAIARQATARVKVVESIDLVPADGEVRIHLVLNMMGSTTRVVVRATVASFHLAQVGGALRLRLLEAPTFSGKNGGKTPGLLGMIGAFGEAALTSMGPEKIAQTVAEFLGPPLSARGDLLMIDLGAIGAVKKALSRETPMGMIGNLVHVTGARFRAGGLEVGLELRPRAAVRSFTGRLFARRLPAGGL